MNAFQTGTRWVSWIVCGAALLIAGGCDKKPAGTTALNAEMAGVAALQAPRREGSTLAYEHIVTVELDESVLATRVEAVRKACAADQQHGCTILNVSTSTHNDVPEGMISVRTAPAGVETLVALASEEGDILQRATRAEDLAQPLADTNRQLSLLSTHRERLSEFMQRKDIGVEQLITVSKELATAQTQIEELTQQKANLRRRIDTDLLTIHFQVPNAHIYGHRTTIGDALRAFGANFREAIASVITFIAYLVPWLVIVLPGLVLLRWFWQAIGRWMRRRDQGQSA